MCDFCQIRPTSSNLVQPVLGRLDGCKLMIYKPFSEIRLTVQPFSQNRSHMRAHTRTRACARVHQVRQVRRLDMYLNIKGNFRLTSRPTSNRLDGIQKSGGQNDSMG